MARGAHGGVDIVGVARREFGERRAGAGVQAGHARASGGCHPAAVDEVAVRQAGERAVLLRFIDQRAQCGAHLHHVRSLIW